MEAYLGIDGGGTKTKLILCDQEGRTLAEATMPTCNYMQVGIDGMKDVLSKGLDAVLNTSGLQIQQISSAFAGIPCFGDIRADIPALQDAVSSALGAVPHRIGNDCEKSLAGTLAGVCGISLICGTGSIACGCNRSGEVMRCGGWHHAIGSDEGSGYWIGIELLHAFTRQSDGRDPRTPLYRLIRTSLQLDEDGDVITRVVDEWRMDRTKIASLSRLIGDLCEQGDPTAERILDRAAAELADMALALYRRLGFTGCMPVSYSGGIFNIGRPILDPLAHKLRAFDMTLCAPKLPPDLGAVVLACRHIGAPIPVGLLK